jgi:hypothetical protein
MKKLLTIVLCIALALCFLTSTSYAKREKFGSDPRHEVAKRVKFKPSTDKVRWKMVMPWSKGLLFYDIATHFCDSVRLATGGQFRHQALFRRRTGPGHAELRRREQGLRPGRS